MKGSVLGFREWKKMSNYVGRGGGQVDSQIYTSKIAVLQRLNTASKRKAFLFAFFEKRFEGRRKDH